MPVVSGAKNKYGAPISYRGPIPCRCYTCNKRKVLSRYPEEYIREAWAQCDICGRLLKVDRCRLRAKFDFDAYERDSGPQCTCKGHPKIHRRGKVNAMYECIHYEDVAIEQAMKGVGTVDTNNTGGCPF